MYDGQDVKKLFYSDRCDMLKHQIIDARLKAVKKGKLIIEKEPFYIEMKYSWDVTASRKLLTDEFRKSLPYHIKGLIFVPAEEGYSKGTNLLKWTSSEKTVSFFLKIETMGSMQRQIAQFYAGGSKKPSAVTTSIEELKAFENTIVECIYDNNRWTIIRHRPDKSFPSFIKSIEAAKKSYIEPITQEALLAYIDKYCDSTTEQSAKRQKCM